MPAPYFLNQTQENQEFEAALRKVVSPLPHEQQLATYSSISKAIPGFEPTDFLVKDGRVLASQRGRTIAFAWPLPLVKLSHIVFGYEELLQRKYCLPGFVEVEEGDVVIDCGAYVGGFSLSAANVASQVHAFEPEEGNFACLRENFADRDNVFANMEGLYSETKDMTLNISASSVEHSLLMPDDGPPISTRTITVRALRDYCEAKGIKQIDFCKIEAEGVELEVFEGLQGILPKKLAIDVSPERNQESPAEEFVRILRPLGYELRRRANVLFARLPAPGEVIPDVPRTIYSLWLQGRANAPEAVKYNLQRWEILNPGYTVNVLDAGDVDGLLGSAGLDLAGISPQSLSDVVRLKLLSDNGGVWVDASVLPMVPLDRWLPDAVSPTGFFAFKREDVPLSSWFLAASVDNLIVERWWRETQRLWNRARRVAPDPVIPHNPASLVTPERLSTTDELPYFWVHCLFAYLLDTDPEVNDIWLRCPNKSAMPPHTLQGLLAGNSSPSDKEIVRAAFAAPVQKLNWRTAYPVSRFTAILERAAPRPPVWADWKAVRLLRKVRARRRSSLGH
jgi:FkbM family methyltransferase